ncbi:hypothetical protein [Nocardia sp. NPDC047654]|uniref:hypothetical protein n=1 Tax=Nocardia sp. NPDC047654 TaxID=3364314 RepID=UPI00371969A0
MGLEYFELSPEGNGMSRLHRRVTLLAATLFGSLLLAPAPAHAAPPNAGIYGIVPNWGGWECVGKFNKVAFVTYHNHSTGKNGGDAGDDIVWIPVTLNRDNHITMSIRCSFGTHLAQNFVIKPTRNGQSFWFRLNGSATRN